VTAKREGEASRAPAAESAGLGFVDDAEVADVAFVVGTGSRPCSRTKRSMEGDTEDGGFERIWSLGF
jgi:hypothetical protein